ncbi:MAG: type III secretion system inner membrane ring subunit SctD [Pseudomonadota bacterium]
MSELVLKVLGGTQAGVEVALPAGEYTIGGADDDDLKLIDVSLKPGHLRLKVGDEGVFLAGGAGNAFVAVQGDQSVEIEPGDDAWQPLEPLAKVTLGATTFAVGAPDAAWSKVLTRPETTEKGRGRRRRSEARGGRRSLVSRVLIAAPYLAVIGLLGWFAMDGSDFTRSDAGVPTAEEQIAAVEQAVRQFDFAADVAIDREVDGIFNVAGYVGTSAERRAVSQALARTGAVYRDRVFARDTIVRDADSLLAAEGYGDILSVGMQQNGTLEIEGILLDPVRVASLVELVRTDVPGPSDVISVVRTVESFLTETRELASVSGIDGTVIIQEVDTMLEATGIIMPADIDAWVGFLQAYSRRIAPYVAMRSFVQLGVPGATVVAGTERTGRPVIVGDAPLAQVDALDPNQLSLGEVDPRALFATPEVGTVAEDDEMAAVLGFMAAEHGIAETVFFEVQDGVVVARGTIFPQNAAGWITFLADFGERFGADMALRSHVQFATATSLDEASRIVEANRNRDADQPILYVSPGTARHAEEGDRVVPFGSFLTGQVGVEDIFTDLDEAGVERLRRLARAVGIELPQGGRAGGAGAIPGGIAALRSGGGGVQTGEDPQADSFNVAGFQRGADGADGEGPNIDWVALRDRRANETLRDLLDAAIASRGGEEGAAADGMAEGTDENDAAVGRLLDELSVSWSENIEGETPEERQEMLSTFLRLFIGKRHAEIPCWENASVTRDNLATALIWLDLLHLAADGGIKEMAPRDQLLLAEAALNPRKLKRCVVSFPEEDGDLLLEGSVYLQDAESDPRVASRVLGPISQADVPILGVTTAGQRTITLVSGERLREGATGAQGSKLLAIGELGALFGTPGGLAVALYGNDLSWRVD